MTILEDEAARVDVVLADDQEIFRAGLRSALGKGPGIRIVGEAESGADALGLCLRQQPDLLIFALEMPEGGYDLLRELQRDSPETRALVLSSRSKPDIEERVIRGGACGFLPKTASESAILQAARAVARGEIWAGRRSTSRLLKARLLRSRDNPGPLLSAREWEVLRLLALGCRNRDIAERLGSSEGTIASQVASIVCKLGVRGRVAAALTGRRLLERRQADRGSTAARTVNFQAPAEGWIH